MTLSATTKHGTSSMEGDTPWYRNPDRVCKDDERYADLTLVVGKGSTKERQRMALACCSCPVYLDCLDDLFAHPMWEHYGIRAGIIGAT